MRGFPKWINTRKDVEHLLKEYPGETMAYLKEQLEARFVWTVVRELVADEDVEPSENQKIVESPASFEKEQNMTRILMELKEDPNAWIFRLGFTVQEIQAILS